MIFLFAPSLLAGAVILAIYLNQINPWSSK